MENRRLENIALKLAIILFMIYDMLIMPKSFLVIVSLFVLLTVVVSLFLLYRSKKNKEWVNILYIVCRNVIIFGLGITSLIMLLNFTIVARDSKEMFVTKCVDKDTFKPNSEYPEKYKIYFLMNQDNEKTYIPVSEDRYNKINIGDSLSVSFKKGIFGYIVLISIDIKDARP